MDKLHLNALEIEDKKNRLRMMQEEQYKSYTFMPQINRSARNLNQDLMDTIPTGEEPEDFYIKIKSKPSNSSSFRQN